MDDAASRPEWFGLADDVADPEFAAVCGAVLSVLRNQIRYFDVDVISDQPWPSDALWAVDALKARIAAAPKRRWLFGLLQANPGITAELDLADDEDFQIALATVPFTISSTGLSDQGLVYSVNDTGTSAAFKLTSIERDRVQQALANSGLAPIPWRPL